VATASARGFYTPDRGPSPSIPPRARARYITRCRTLRHRTPARIWNRRSPEVERSIFFFFFPVEKPNSPLYALVRFRDREKPFFSRLILTKLRNRVFPAKSDRLRSVSPNPSNRIPDGDLRQCSVKLFVQRKKLSRTSGDGRAQNGDVTIESVLLKCAVCTIPRLPHRDQTDVRNGADYVTITLRVSVGLGGGGH
jgi:hypothetical protein